MDAPASRELPTLKNTLIRLKQASDEAKSPTMVTIVSEPHAKYGRTVDVLDALAVAGVSNVTFTGERGRMRTEETPPRSRLGFWTKLVAKPSFSS